MLCALLETKVYWPMLPCNDICKRYQSTSTFRLMHQRMRSSCPSYQLCWSRTWSRSSNDSFIISKKKISQRHLTRQISNGRTCPSGLHVKTHMISDATLCFFVVFSLLPSKSRNLRPNMMLKNCMQLRGLLQMTISRIADSIHVIFIPLELLEKLSIAAPVYQYSCSCTNS